MQIKLYLDEDALHRRLKQAMSERGGEQMRRLMRIVNTRTVEQMTNQLEFLSNWG
jgi:hypothetical protein